MCYASILYLLKYCRKWSVKLSYVIIFKVGNKYKIVSLLARRAPQELCLWSILNRNPEKAWLPNEVVWMAAAWFSNHSSWFVFQSEDTAVYVYTEYSNQTMRGSSGYRTRSDSIICWCRQKLDGSLLFSFASCCSSVSTEITLIICLFYRSPPYLQPSWSLSPLYHF